MNISHSDNSLTLTVSTASSSRKAKKLERRTRALEYTLSEKEVLEEIISSVSNEVNVCESEYNMLPAGRTLFQKVMGKNKGRDFNKKGLIELVAAFKAHLQELLKKREMLEFDINKLTKKIQKKNVSTWDDVSDVMGLVFKGSNIEKVEIQATRFSLFQDSIKPTRYNELRTGMHVYCRTPGGGYTLHGICMQSKRKGLYVLNFTTKLSGGSSFLSRHRRTTLTNSNTLSFTSCSPSEFCNDTPLFVAKYKYEAPPIVIQARAKRVLHTGGDPYDYVEKTPEQLASWCVTGVGRRLQINDFLFERMQKVGEVADRLADRSNLSRSSSSITFPISSTSSTSCTHHKEIVVNSLMHLPYPLLQLLANFVHTQNTKHIVQ